MTLVTRSSSASVVVPLPLLQGPEVTEVVLDIKDTENDDRSAVCGQTCRGILFEYLFCYLAILRLCALLAHVIPSSMGLIAVCPFIVICWWYNRVFGRGIDKCQAISTCVTSMLYIIPMLALSLAIPWESLYRFVTTLECGEEAECRSDLDVGGDEIDMKMPVVEDGGVMCSCHLRVLVISFIQAGLMEELLKYVAVAVTMKRSFVADPRGAVGYALIAAIGFATVENIAYVLSSGEVAVGISRGMLSIPLHALTGLLIGVGISKRQFLDRNKGEKFQVIRILFLPWLLHGCYDYVQLMPHPASWGGVMTVTWVMGVDAILLGGGYLWLRVEWVRLCEEVELVDVKQLQQQGHLPRASRYTCLYDACCACPLPFACCGLGKCLPEGARAGLGDSALADASSPPAGFSGDFGDPMNDGYGGNVGGCGGERGGGGNNWGGVVAATMTRLKLPGGPGAHKQHDNGDGASYYHHPV